MPPTVATSTRADAPSARKEDAPKRKRELNARVCQVIGCEETYSSVHECRARACTAHCSAEAVELEGREPGTQWRYCYQCHKFHELEAFSSPDGSALALHNCYGSQQRRLKRRKLKEQEKQQDVAAKKLAEELERRTGGPHAGPLFATLHQPAMPAFTDAVSAAAAADLAGPWAVAGATIAARRLGAKAAMSAGTWCATPLATPSPPSSGEVSPKHGAAATNDAAPGALPGAPLALGAGSYLHLGASLSLLPPMDDKLMHALDEYLAHSPSP